MRHNNVLGYFVEVSAAHAERLMDGGKEAAAETYGMIHRQTMANAVRFTTVELSELDDKIARAGERALAIELTCSRRLSGQVLDHAEDIAMAARALADLDVSAALAERAVQARYVRPRLVEDGVFRVFRRPPPGGRGDARRRRARSSPTTATCPAPPRIARRSAVASGW